MASWSMVILIIVIIVNLVIVIMVNGYHGHGLPNPLALSE